MTNPFESDNDKYYALVNDEGQYSLWPAYIPVPEGWTPDLGPDSRTECLAAIASKWNDMRPPSLRVEAGMETL